MDQADRGPRRGRDYDATAAAAVADCANGLGSKLDITKWTFLNNDLVVHVHRIPAGEWIGIRAETSYGPDGIGITVGTLFDERAAIGAIQQSVLVRRRSS